MSWSVEIPRWALLALYFYFVLLCWLDAVELATPWDDEP